MSSKLIANFHFAPGQGFDPIAGATFSDSTKLGVDRKDGSIKLILQSITSRYSLDSNLNVRPAVRAAEAVRRLVLVEVLGTFPEGTSARLRLYDGTNERWWSGSAWTIAGTSDWNTVAEINAHLATYPVATTRQFAPVLNLRTTDDRYTPVVTEIKMLWEGDVEWTADVLIDSFTRTLQDELTFPVNLALPPVSVATSSINLTAYTIEDAPQFTAALAVYDHLNDPHHLTNLLGSYDAGTRILTISPAIPIGGIPYLRMNQRPQIAWDTQQDWAELGRLPQVILRNVDGVDSYFYPIAANEGIVDRVNLSAYEIPAPFKTDYRLEVEVRTNRSREQLGLLDRLTAFFAGGPAGEVGPFIRSRATGERVVMVYGDPFTPVDIDTEIPDLRIFRARVVLQNVLNYVRPARATKAVGNMKFRYAASDAKAVADAVSADAPIKPNDVEIIE